MTGPAGLHGITWDHPRGWSGLFAVTQAYERLRPEIRITWDKQPLRGFEETPIGQLAERYDLIILDHPFMGDASVAGCLVDLDRHSGVLGLAALSRDVAGPSFEIYRYGGLWAVPLDGASQMSAYRSDRMDVVPRTLDEVRIVARGGPLAMALNGVHSLMALFSVYSNIGVPPDGDGEPLLESGQGVAALELLREIAGWCPPEALDWNSIATLDAMSLRDDLAYCPYVFGFASYSRPAPGRHRLAFADVPAVHAENGCRGAVLGGTGIAISRRCRALEEALAFVAYLAAADTQQRTGHAGGQPVRRSVWESAALNAEFAGFYRNTIRSMDRSAVRPRYPRYISLQIAGGNLVENFLRHGGRARDVINAVNGLHCEARFGQPRSA